MLLSTGEQITIAKLSILLNEMGYNAISLTGWQAGIYTNNTNIDALVQNIDVSRIEKELANHPESSWTFIKGSIADKTLIDKIFEEHKPDIVVNLAAQAGVRYSVVSRIFRKFNFCRLVDCH